VTVRELHELWAASYEMMNRIAEPAVQQEVHEPKTESARGCSA
jgi:hypothetical protein